MKKLATIAFIAAVTAPVFAAMPMDAPNAEKLKSMSVENRVSCSVVNAAMSKIVRKSGDAKHAGAYAARALQFVSSEEIWKAGTTTKMLDDLTNQAVDLANTEPESKIELRSVITQCDTWVELEPIMPNTSE